MRTLVSICIPTYNRQAFLAEAMRSCVEQDYRPLEILIGDDSAAPETRDMIAAIASDREVRIRYFAHQRRLGQADNLNYLLDWLTGEYFVVLHDDDLLVSGAIRKLHHILDMHSDVVSAFGLQYVVDDTGQVQHDMSRDLNRVFERTPERAGKQESIMGSALIRQFPNDGFMLRHVVAEQVRYRSAQIVGTGCDFDFGIQVADAFPDRKAFFLNDYTTKYRLSGNQISANPVRTPMFFVLTELRVDEQDAKHLAKVKGIFAVRAVFEAIMNSDKAAARRIFFSSHYPAQQRWRPKGFAFLLTMFLPIDSRVTWRLLCKLARGPLRMVGHVQSGSVVSE